MSQSTPERDWKCMKRLHDELLASLCKRINAKAEEILTGARASEYEKYLKLFKHLRDSDGVVGGCFDDWRRSTLMEKIYFLRHHGILQEEHILQLSDETQQRLELMKGL